MFRWFHVLIHVLIPCSGDSVYHLSDALLLHSGDYSNASMLCTHTPLHHSSDSSSLHWYFRMLHYTVHLLICSSPVSDALLACSSVPLCHLPMLHSNASLTSSNASLRNNLMHSLSHSSTYYSVSLVSFDASLYYLSDVLLFDSRSYSDPSMLCTYASYHYSSDTFIASVVCSDVSLRHVFDAFFSFGWQWSNDSSNASLRLSSTLLDWPNPMIRYAVPLMLHSGAYCNAFIHPVFPCFNPGVFIDVLLVCSSVTLRHSLMLHSRAYSNTS